MIGGSDSFVDGEPALDEAEFIVKWFLQAAWPEAVVQDADSEQAVSPDDPAVHGLREFFVYKTRGYFESWSKDGETEENRDAMVHVFIEAASTSFVTATEPSETFKLVERLRSAILTYRESRR